MFLDPVLVKLHLRVNHTVDDALIALYTSAAEDSVEAFLNRKVYPSQAGLAGESLLVTYPGIVANDMMRVAALLLIGSLYENREQDIVNGQVFSLPYGFDTFLWPHRMGVGV